MGVVAVLYLLFLILLQPQSYVIAALFEHIQDIPPTDYDFVILGGGTAGSVVANRLSENQDVNVLLVEAGGPNMGILPIDIPLFTYIIPSQYEWNTTTIPQPALNNRSVNFPHAFILGGSSSHNGMIYNRGPKDDWDRYARLTGDDGWSWNSIQPFIAKNERWTPPADNHNTTGQYDPAIHSTTGINSVTLEGFSLPIDSLGLQASQQLGGIFSFNLDYNSGNPLGLSWAQYTINNGTRSSAAASYLAPNFLQRPNLHVLVNARGSRVLQITSDSKTPAFLSVEFAHDLDGPLYHAKASKEVIISTGAINTPQILLNSGIGNSSFLSSIGIQPLVHLPGVGQNMSVHASTKNAWIVNSSAATDDIIFQNQTLQNLLVDEWMETKQGPLVDSPETQNVYLRFNQSTLEILGEDPSSGPTAPHVSLGMQPGFFPIVPPTGKFLTLSTTILTPTSRKCSITINSTLPLNVFAPPVVDAKTLTTRFDILGMREAIRTAIAFFSAPAWDEYIVGPTSNLAAALESDDALDEYIRSIGGPNEHVVGTASMTAEDADYGVVNPDLLVKCVEGLRIVDASVLPLVTAGHTQAPVYIVAERASSLIKKKWGI
ncbi:alcohol oxidase [Gymnopus androsaceus JB14]|uniref:Alcohol oxidase n=1 Tax=Gymnopus androsaceus JB14 TaxID=1447944 RepID=A0A6A4HN49_9AGAR|nr:alcohol oxidase [Gymnopus androsaceus JB14]